MKNRILPLLTIFFTTAFTPVANPDYFSAPLKIPMQLAGNFGELRTNHFHSGIDIKTEGRTGLQVYAAADGEISRINISPFGFGLALYIDHPNGTTTVYGHLLKLRDDLQKYARSVQYDKESFSIDIPVPKGMFKVKKEELIAYSGNSGSSGGPHLHFEIRETANQHPVNPLLYNFNVQDNTSPKILSAVLYPLSNDSHVSGKTYAQRIETVYYNGAFHLKNNPTLLVYGDIGFGLQTLDYLDGSWSKCGVYEINLSVDDEPVFSFRANELSFDETRYLNSHIDYSQFQKYSRRIQKNWVEPGNYLHNYPVLQNRGISRLDDGKTHTISYEVRDVKGNSSKLEFNVISKKIDVKRPEKDGIPMYYNKPAEIEKDGLEASFKTGTFYSDFILDYKERSSNNLYYSPIYKLQNSETPVHQFYNLKVKAVNLPEELEDKALLAAIDEKTGKKWALGGNYSHGWVEARVRQLGSFAIAIDTIPPSIVPINIQNRNTITDRTKISFKISDGFSGIGEYRGEIDGKWVLFEYDAKNRLLEYKFDAGRMEFNKKHQLKLVVSDTKGNTKTYEATFYR